MLFMNSIQSGTVQPTSTLHDDSFTKNKESSGYMQYNHFRILPT